MVCFVKWITFAQTLLLVTAVFGTASYRARKRAESPASSQTRHYPSKRGFSLYKNSRYIAARSYSTRTQSASASQVTTYPGGTRKRTAYTGRYCAYTKTQLAPHRVPNGTETFLKQVVTKCHWSSVYCTPSINYVVSTRRTYRTVMKKVKKEYWACCPGFEGENCDNTCYNCTVMSALKEKVSNLEKQISGSLPLSQTGNVRPNLGEPGVGQKGETGPTGPRGPAGENGAIGPRGPVGPRGRTGVAGDPGSPGEVGPRGPMGFHGQKGDRGLHGPPGPAGPAGENGQDGQDGAVGPPGQKGEGGIPGLVGLQGPKGDTGANGADGSPGPVGPSGPPGSRGMDGVSGTRGEPGPPGPPGQCGCQDGDDSATTKAATTTTATTTTRATATTTSAAAGPGSSACQYNGQYRQEDEMWTNEDCEECFCVEGSVSCLSITCPELSCLYQYKPEGYCCPICCRYQTQNDYVSGMSGDGATETIPDEYYAEMNSSMVDYIDSESNDSESEYSMTMSELSDLSDMSEMSEISLTALFENCPRPSENDDRMTMKSNVLDRCQLTKDPGPCSRRYQRYYYDKVLQQCRLFTYGGCEGNANLFLTQKECESTCWNRTMPAEPPSALHESTMKSLCIYVPADDEAKTCKMSDYRFAVDEGTGRCHRFLYKGCGKNKPGFERPDECVSTCNAGSPVYTGVITRGGLMNDAPAPPAALIDSPMRNNLFPRCLERKETGNCRGSFIRFYYDYTENRCKTFVYGGCGGNENRFMTPWECRESCGGGDPLYFEEERPVCSLDPKTSSCKGSMKRYYYDQELRSCRMFAWGGCDRQEQANRFETEEECTIKCGMQIIKSRSTASSVCTEPVSPGPCLAHVYRFFYDPVTRRCSTFIYGGCNGNGNNFETPEKCLELCGGERVNYTVTEPSVSSFDARPGSEESGRRGERGPPGPSGPPGIGIKGDMGPPGPKGERGDSAALDSYAEEIKSLKTQLDELTSMVLTHVANMGQHAPQAPTEEGASEYEDGEYTIPPLSFFSDLQGSRED